MNTILARLILDFNDINFMSDTSFYWSPQKKTIFYRQDMLDKEQGIWTLLHEIGHALSGHKVYRSDVHLLHIEMEAWEKAKNLALLYKQDINASHIQNCLDTYRDWLYGRSMCPVCTNNGLQINPFTYGCINCKSTWKVSRSRTCRTYRYKKNIDICV
ncbi:ImmA/IrrE family metallo-endopeptidase [Candidatus Saccharibacteria bacterium]|nr:ImmA/IrrE family metallo-endopeptidase [Candidatus Saccharibacteria bacterium]